VTFVVDYEHAARTSSTMGRTRRRETSGGRDAESIAEITAPDAASARHAREAHARRDERARGSLFARMPSGRGHATLAKRFPPVEFRVCGRRWIRGYRRCIACGHGV